MQPVCFVADSGYDGVSILILTGARMQHLLITCIITNDKFQSSS